MAGNVWEWTLDGYSEHAYADLPKGPAMNPFVIADDGRAYAVAVATKSPAAFTRASARMSEQAGAAGAGLGLGCVRSLDDG